MPVTVLEMFVVCIFNNDYNFNKLLLFTDCRTKLHSHFCGILYMKFYGVVGGIGQNLTTEDTHNLAPHFEVLVV